MHLIQFFKENNLALFWLSFAEVLILLKTYTSTKLLYVVHMNEETHPL